MLRNKITISAITCESIAFETNKIQQIVAPGPLYMMAMVTHFLNIFCKWISFFFLIAGHISPPATNYMY